MSPHDVNCFLKLILYSINNYYHSYPHIALIFTVFNMTNSPFTINAFAPYQRRIIKLAMKLPHIYSHNNMKSDTPNIYILHFKTPNTPTIKPCPALL